MVNSLFSLSWMLGLLLAPHALALLGNLAGAYQYFFFIWLALAAWLYWVNAQSINQVFDASQTSYPGNLRMVLIWILTASRLVSAITLSTVLLVTAGFVFNETFVYWFPNFAFAFILLGGVLAVHLWSRDTAQKLQVGAVLFLLLGLVSLITMGLWGYNGQRAFTVGMAAAFKPHGIASTLLLFAGFDLVLNPFRTNSPSNVRTMQWTLVAAALVMGVWAMMSLLYVPAAKLTDSFIPHLLAARSIQGEAGRAIMGAVVITGSAAAVNALFKSLSDLFAEFGVRWSRGRDYKWLQVLERPAVWTSFIAATVGLMMAGGMAGTESIDLYVRFGFILWIFSYGGINFYVLMARRPIFQSLDWKGWVFPAVATVSMVLGGGVLLLADSNGSILLNYFLIWVIIMVVGALAVLLFKKALSYDKKWKYNRQR